LDKKKDNPNPIGLEEESATSIFFPARSSPTRKQAQAPAPARRRSAAAQGTAPRRGVRIRRRRRRTGTSPRRSWARRRAPASRPDRTWATPAARRSHMRLERPWPPRAASP